MNIFLAVPYYDEIEPRVKKMVDVALERNKASGAMPMQSSFLTFNFNAQWCYVLNHKEFDYFVMLHADITPKVDNWLTRLIKTADAYDADIVSAVMPIKQDTGHTSTALGVKGEYMRFRRLMMRELDALPETFSTQELAGYFGQDAEKSYLMVNTGLMCIRLEKREQFTHWNADGSPMTFRISNRILQEPNGHYYALSEPEDWYMSREAADHNLKVCATKAIPAVHIGRTKDYPNDSAWGTLDHDGGDTIGRTKNGKEKEKLD